MQILKSLGCLLLLSAASIDAQHYDPYYVLPGPAGRFAADAGLFNRDISSLTDASTLLAMGKYSLSDDLEVGVAADLGLLQQGAGSLARLQTGAKLGLSPNTAISGTAVLPIGDIEDVGVAVGLMKTLYIAGAMVNARLSGALLDGYTAEGVDLSLLVEPTMSFGDQVTGYMDILIGSQTEDPGDHLSIDLGPNADINLNETAVVNVGITLGLAGDARQDDIGLAVSLITAY